MAFTIELPVGESTLSANYRSRAAGSPEEDPTATWYFAYILAPAKEWKSLDRLVVTAYVPEGWESRSTPELERDRDVLRGEFTGVPADALVLAVRAHLEAEVQRATVIYLSFYGIVVLGGGVCCWLMGHMLGRCLVCLAPSPRRGWLFYCLMPLMILPGLSWAMSIWWAWFFALRGIFASLSDQKSPYFHEQFTLPGLAQLLIFPIALVGGNYLCGSAANRVRRRLQGGWRDLGEGIHSYNQRRNPANLTIPDPFNPESS
jgi:hypothetical protein